MNILLFILPLFVGTVSWFCIYKLIRPRKPMVIVGLVAGLVVTVMAGLYLCIPLVLLTLVIFVRRKLKPAPPGVSVPGTGSEKTLPSGNLYIRSAWVTLALGAGFLAAGAMAAQFVPRGMAAGMVFLGIGLAPAVLFGLAAVLLAVTGILKREPARRAGVLLLVLPVLGLIVYISCHQ